MNCFYHTDTEAVAECTNGCKKPLCRDCYNAVNFNICYDCAAITLNKQSMDFNKLLGTLFIGMVVGVLIGIFLLNRIFDNYLVSCLMGIGFIPAFKLYHNLIASRFVGTLGFFIFLYAIGVLLSIIVSVFIIPFYIFMLVKKGLLYKRSKASFLAVYSDFVSSTTPMQ